MNLVSKNGLTCALAVIKIKSDKVLASTSECKNKQLLSKGTILTDGGREPMAHDDVNDKWRIAIGVGQATSGRANFESVKASNGTNSIDAKMEMQFNNATVFAIEVRQLPTDSWGFLAGINYELARKITGGSITVNNVKTKLSGGSDSIQFTTLYASAAYRWETLYLPFGLNHSLVKYKTNGTLIPKVEGVIGEQVGIGWTLSREFAVEIHSWINGFKLSSTNSGTSIDTGVGYIPSLLLVGKYVF
ncbi:MAG: hypothetical protein HC902_09440 [Calothrix sp. SM1_5_4]|nr:hypothetical protein [Calothrix sp. SM1_5_4]